MMQDLTWRHAHLEREGAAQPLGLLIRTLVVFGAAWQALWRVWGTCEADGSLSWCLNHIRVI